MLLKLEWASEWPGELVERTHFWEPPQGPDSVSLGVGWGVGIFAKLPDDADGAGLSITRFEETANSERLLSGSTVTSHPHVSS